MTPALEAGVADHVCTVAEIVAFSGVPPATMRPTALVLNLAVASIATYRFGRAGFFRWSVFWPFALGSIPLAYMGGAVTLPGYWYRTLVGFVLWAAAARLLVGDSRARNARAPSRILAVACGAAIGFLSGLTGTGGGIFLSPLLIFTGWAEMRETGGVSAGSSWQTPLPASLAIHGAWALCRHSSRYGSLQWFWAV